METAANERRKMYARVVVVDYRLFEKWLNLPEGFRIVHPDTPADGFGLRLMVECPPEERFEVGEGAWMPCIMASCRTNEHGIMDAMWWPDLGQEEPPSPPELVGP
jgi:hypothetical protein